MLDQAAEDFRLILDNPGIDPVWPEFTLSHLRLARVPVRHKKCNEARREYQALLSAWKDGDAQIPLLIQAMEEYATLPAN
jgi:hypothetical protein